MAIYTFIPNSLTGGQLITDAEYAYTDTSSSTAAMASLVDDGSQGSAFLGFTFAIPSSEEVLSATVKVKTALYDTGDPNVGITLLSAPNGIALSNTITISSATPTVYTFTLTASAESIVAYGSTLCIRFEVIDDPTDPFIYGAEVIVETEAEKGRNKIVYGNNTLIDLTGDTVTESDVANGKTVHLPSGIQVTGSYLPSPLKATATTTGSTDKTVSLTVTKEPSWFLLVCANATTQRAYRILYYMYDGEKVHFGRSKASSTYGQVEKVTSASVTFAYSSNTLTFTAPSSATNRYFGAADWELYYL